MYLNWNIGAIWVIIGGIYIAIKCQCYITTLWNRLVLLHCRTGHGSWNGANAGKLNIHPRQKKQKSPLELLERSKLKGLIQLFLLRSKGRETSNHGIAMGEQEWPHGGDHKAGWPRDCEDGQVLNKASSSVTRSRFDFLALRTSSPATEKYEKGCTMMVIQSCATPEAVAKES